MNVRWQRDMKTCFTFGHRQALTTGDWRQCELRGRELSKRRRYLRLRIHLMLNVFDSGYSSKLQSAKSSHSLHLRNGSARIEEGERRRMIMGKRRTHNLLDCLNVIIADAYSPGPSKVPSCLEREVLDHYTR